MGIQKPQKTVDKAISMKLKGMTNQEVGDKLKISPDCIARWWRETEHYEPPPPPLTEEQIDYVRELRLNGTSVIKTVEMFRERFNRGIGNNRVREVSRDVMPPKEEPIEIRRFWQGVKKDQDKIQSWRRTNELRKFISDVVRNRPRLPLQDGTSPIPRARGNL